MTNFKEWAKRFDRHQIILNAGKLLIKYVFFLLFYYSSYFIHGKMR